MRALALLFAGVLATSLSACVFVSERDPGPPGPPGPEPDPNEGRLDVTWRLLASADDQPAGCPAGATTAEVVTVHRGSSCPGPECYIDCFDCAPGQGVTAPLPAGIYEVFVNITDADETQCGTGDPTLLAQSSLKDSAVRRGEVLEVDFDFHGDGGFVRLAWELVAGEEPLDCAGAPEGTGLLMTLVAGDGADPPPIEFDCEGRRDHPFVADCGDRCGVTDAVLVGEYDVLVDAIDDGGEVLASCGDAENAAIRFGNDLVDLGTFVCDLDTIDRL
jgi:hypothetical protein